MTYVFWQNILSIHQSAFIRSLTSDSRVILAVERETEERRVKDGWAAPDFGRTEVYITPADDLVDKLLAIEDAVHVFTGIGSYVFVHKVFKKAVKRKLRIGIISEPFDWLGIKGRIRYLRLALLGRIYGSSIAFILAIGHRGRRCFERAGFDKHKIFDWGYFTEFEEQEYTGIVHNGDAAEKAKLIFVGRITRNKGILELVRLCKTMEEDFHSLTIIGHGEQEGELKDLIGSSAKFNYMGALPNEETRKNISRADIAILPSIGKDGWGAVVNEALLLGVPVITSDYCGASVLLDNERGEVFQVKRKNLEVVMKKWLNKGMPEAHEKERIRKWAIDNLSGMTAAAYFKDIVNYCYSRQAERPVAPWFKEQ